MSASQKNSFGKVCVFMGGTSGERAVSLESGANVLAGLQKLGINVFAFDPKEQELIELLKEKPDKIFMILHGDPGEDGRYQGFFDLQQLPYTGSGMEASAVSLNKMISKTIWQKLAIPTPDFLVITENNPEEKKSFEKYQAALSLPIVVKPANEGSSLGISIVNSFDQWIQAISLAQKYRGLILAEKYIKGKEYTFGVIGEHALPGVLIKYQRSFYDYHAKYSDEGTQLICPCGIGEHFEKKLQELAIKAACALGCRGWYRVDYIIDELQNPYILEVNTAPGMTSHSLIPSAAKKLGWSYEQTLIKILENTKFDKVTE